MQPITSIPNLTETPKMLVTGLGRTAVCLIPSANRYHLPISTVLILLLIKRVREIAKTDYKLRHVCVSAQNNSVPTGRIKVEFYI
jgi:hypothetical protein